MARGWESKSVEQQQEEKAADREKKSDRPKAEQLAQQQRRTSLELSRKRILQQLELAVNPRHREMLKAALADLDAKLKG